MLCQDPEEFKLGRWLEEDSTLMDYFIPFSIGPRACIGRKYVPQFPLMSF